MLSRIHITNFRCFPHVDVELRPLTVLVGPNDSGKSAFLASIKQLVELNQNFGPTDFWRTDHQLRIEIMGWDEVGKIFVASDGHSERHHENLRPCTVFQLPAHGIPMESGGQDDSLGPPQLTEQGGNVPTFFDYALRRDRKRFFEIVDALRGSIPGLQDIDVKTPGGGNRRVDVRVEGDLSFPPDRQSVGVRLMIFFVALAFHPTPPKLILVEEPENGVHPKRLADIVKLLRGITKGEHADHRAQVILTTHSPYLLDHVDLNTDQVLVFRRKDDGSRTAEAADRERLKNFLDEFMLGEVWYNEGEAGLVRQPS